MIYNWKRNFVLLLSHVLVNLSTTNIDKVASMLFSQHGWTWVDSTFLFNLISTLKQNWVINVETTSRNICRLNFHFQSNFNVETTLVHRRWIDVILSTLFQCCFANVETTSIIVRRLNFHFQPNINVETLMNVWRSTLFQRWCVCWVIAGKTTVIKWILIKAPLVQG